MSDRGRGGTTMRCCLDLCSVHRNVAFIIGWSEAGAPTIIFDGQQVAVESVPAPRPDLPAHFGAESAQWGFNLTAILPVANPRHDRIALRFSDGTHIEFPGSKFTSPDDADYGEMTSQFREATKRGGRALEIGSRARSGDSYRFLIDPSVQYVGLDIAAGPNVDVVGDAHHLSRHVQGKFDYILSISVFEHLLMPWMVALEMNRVMHAGGIAFVQSHPSFPLHEEPWDFWRYSKDSWVGLFNVHTGFRVIRSGYAMGARIVADFAEGGATQRLGGSRTYLLSGCLVEKIAEPKVAWAADAAEVYNLNYNYG